MLSLTEHNEDRKQEINRLERIAHLANVLCPDCLVKDKQIELHYLNRNIVLTSNPLKKDVKCPECNFKDYKIV